MAIAIKGRIIKTLTIKIMSCKYCNKSGGWILHEVLCELVKETADSQLNKKLNQEQIEKVVAYVVDTTKLSELIDDAINHALYEE